MSRVAKLREKYQGVENERFFKELFEYEEYQAILTRPLTMVLDIGALAGEFAAYIYDKAGTIYALEPFSRHYEELAANVNEFGLVKIKPFRLALSSSNGTARLTTDMDRGGNHLLEREGNTEEVPTKTLAQFMKDEGIKHVDVLKIDIEGNEELVFKSPDFPEVAPLIDCIIGEHLGGCLDVLRNLGFTMREDKLNNVVFER